MESIGWKNIIAIGQTGDGKSFLLNTLAGYDPDDDNSPFKVGSTTDS